MSAFLRVRLLSLVLTDILADKPRYWIVFDWWLRGTMNETITARIQRYIESEA